MSWAVWFLIVYIAAAAWVATTVCLHEVSDSCKGRPMKAGLIALIAMWVMPALFAGAMFTPSSKWRR
ncbi:hypothetical protein A3734_00090 [Sulfitobacter sp. HI0054]|nr:hypothetical protein A3734_00090 [Sulfitobacter sp. HI0054]